MFFAFLPCRKNSQRVPKKNTRQISNYKNGLIEIKLNQLIKTSLIDKIFLSTDDLTIIKYAETLKNKKIILHKRDDNLASNSTETNQLINHASELCADSKYIMWTHTTSPFLNSIKYSELIETFLNNINKGFDSLMTVTKLQGFLWDNNKPINYDRSKTKWPRTQTIEPYFEVNSGAFISSRENYIKNQDRIGRNPYLYNLDKLSGWDIDWPEDFEIAEKLINSGLLKI